MTDHDLVAIQTALLGFADKVSGAMKEQLFLTLKILLQLNEQIKLTNNHLASLNQKSTPNKSMKEKLDVVHKDITRQNKTLIALEKEQLKAKTLVLSKDVPLTSDEVNSAKKMFNELGTNINALRKSNSHLLEAAKMLRQEQLRKGSHAAKRSHSKPDHSVTHKPRFKPGGSY